MLQILAMYAFYSSLLRICILVDAKFLILFAKLSIHRFLFKLCVLICIV